MKTLAVAFALLVAMQTSDAGAYARVIVTPGHVEIIVPPLRAPEFRDLTDLLPDLPPPRTPRGDPQPPPPRPPGPARCRNFISPSRLKDDEKQTLAAYAQAIVRALMPTLEAQGIHARPSSAEFIAGTYAGGRGEAWVLRFHSQNATLQVAYESLLGPSTERPPYPDYFRGEQVLPQSQGNPVAAVSRGFDNEGNVVVCNVIGAELRITRVENIESGVAVTGPLSLAISSSVIATMAPHRDPL